MVLRESYQIITTPVQFLESTACPPTIQNGSTGIWVRRLQGSLDWSYNIFSISLQSGFSIISIDGNFGSLTQAAAETFQRVKWSSDAILAREGKKELPANVRYLSGEAGPGSMITLVPFTVPLFTVNNGNSDDAHQLCPYHAR